jgi:hypothetical protein
VEKWILPQHVFATHLAMTDSRGGVYIWWWWYKLLQVGGAARTTIRLASSILLVSCHSQARKAFDD